MMTEDTMELPGNKDMEIRRLRYELEAKQMELDALGAELEKRRQVEPDLEEERRAIIYMLEDMNEAAARIEAAKKEWMATFDAIEDPIFIHDSDFRVARANRAYIKMAGASFSDVIGSPYYKFFPKHDRPHDFCLRILEYGLNEEENDVQPENIDRIYKVKSYRIGADADGARHFVHVMRDVTEERKASANMKQEMELNAHLLMIAEASARTTDIETMMEQVAECSRLIMAGNACLSYLLDKGAMVFRPCRASGLPQHLHPGFKTGLLDSADEIINAAFAGKMPEIINYPGHAASALPVFDWLAGAKTAVIIPLMSINRRLGILVLIYNANREFTERDMNIMKGISHQVSIAVEQARLYRESVETGMYLSRRIELIQVMHEIDRSILSTLKPDAIMETVARLIARVVACDRATVAVVDRERKGFVVKAAIGIAPAGFTLFDQTIATEVVETGMPQYIPDIRKIKEPLPIEKLLIELGFISDLRIPLRVKGEVHGVLSIGARRLSAFSKEDLEALEKIAAQIGVALENARLISDLDDLFLGTIRSLSSAIDAKSRWTAGHSERVTEYAVAMARAMGLDESSLKELEISGLLHDVGKIGTYEAILNKSDKLTDEEFAIIRQHPGKGAEILYPIKQLRNIISGVKYHHEFYDGSGYPEGLKADAIPIYGRILAVADAVDAMGADRPYRRGRPMNDTIAELKRCSGAQFDPKIVDAFLQTSYSTSYCS